jgi:hypothetical protein
MAALRYHPVRRTRAGRDETAADIAADLAADTAADTAAETASATAPWP